MNAIFTPPRPAIEPGLNQIALIAGHRNAPMYFRVLPTEDDLTNFGPTSLRDFWPVAEAEQAKGRSIFVIPNPGGHDDAAITSIRAVFIDADDRTLPEDWEWHLKPDFILQRDDRHWHAYWRVAGIDKGNFASIQKRLAAFYGTDRSIINPSRIMRLAGTVHFKGGIASPGYRISYGR